MRGAAALLLQESQYYNTMWRDFVYFYQHRRWQYIQEVVFQGENLPVLGGSSAIPLAPYNFFLYVFTSLHY